MPTARLAAALALVAAAALSLAAAQPVAAPPRLQPRGASAELVVDGSPFLVLGGELGNSSGEPGYLERWWPRLKALNLNTVLAPVYWELVEPREGQFDFATVDGLIAGARGHGVRLVLLWFGSWKNSMSCYAPAWVKTDTRRFPRAADASGRGLDILTPFAPANRDADARAFAALMRHLREVDGGRYTVLMVQVENEVGMIPEARDRSAGANAAFDGAVPRELLESVRRHPATLPPALREAWEGRGRPAAGGWAEVFGPGPATEELFTAWHLARYLEAVVSAGKAEYSLPMFANAALIRPGYRPGQYPSGGPLPHLAAVWRAAAPSIDFISPDIYFPNFAEWCRLYARPGNPLFVPEARRGVEASVHALYAAAAHDAIGFAPFGIESIGEPAGARLAESYRLLAALAPTLTAHRGRGTMAGLLPEIDPQPQPQEVSLGGYRLRVVYERQVAPSIADGESGGAAPVASPAGGLVVATGPDEFLFAGIGVTATFAVEGSDDRVGLLSVEEGSFEAGAWRHERWLNGDETHQGRHVRLEPGRFGTQRVRVYRHR